MYAVRFMCALAFCISYCLNAGNTLTKLNKLLCAYEYKREGSDSEEEGFEHEIFVGEDEPGAPKLKENDRAAAQKNSEQPGLPLHHPSHPSQKNLHLPKAPYVKEEEESGTFLEGKHSEGKRKKKHKKNAQMLVLKNNQSNSNPARKKRKKTRSLLALDHSGMLIIPLCILRCTSEEYASVPFIMCIFEETDHQ